MTGCRLTALGAACLGALPSVAAAEPSGSGELWLDATAAHLDVPGRATSFALLGLGARGAIGHPWIGYRAGIDARLGAAVQGGFAYDAALYPVGLSFPVGKPIALGLGAGIGASGVTSRVPSTGRVPVELALDASVTRWLRLGTWCRPAWTFATARQDGTEQLPPWDEFEAGLRIRVGKGNDKYGMVFGNGLFAAAIYGEQLGATLIGVAIGHGLDIRNP